MRFIALFAALIFSAGLVGTLEAHEAPAAVYSSAPAEGAGRVAPGESADDDGARQRRDMQDELDRMREESRTVRMEH